MSSNGSSNAASNVLDERSMYLYIVSAEYWIKNGWVKVGLTIEPYGRRSTYLTGCPPLQEPSVELDYVKIFRVRANSEKELKRFESTVHDKYADFRGQRATGEWTEWFHFPPQSNFLQNITQYISCQHWFLQDIPLECIKRPKRFMLQRFNRNLENHIYIAEDYNKKREKSQIEYIEKVREFAKDPTLFAAFCEAPCGFGKTVCTVKGVSGIVNRIFVCVPTTYLKQQWYNTFTNSNISSFTKDDIFEEFTEEISKREKFIILVCYASTHMYVETNFLNRIELAICDEAHRLAGISEMKKDDDEDSEEKVDVGRTKRLFRSFQQKNIKRLSLTFTPKSYREGEDETIIVNSNDDKELFGEVIISITLRSMIEKGLLPDYRIHFPTYDAMGKGMKAKAELIYNSFQSRLDDEYSMNHLIVFGKSHKDCLLFEKYLQEYFEGSGVQIFTTLKSNDVAEHIRNFQSSKRGILINCKLLGEGVDVPLADSVCILYPKQSQIEITQMLLRPGRYHPDKSVFHILLAITEDEDYPAIENTLLALAIADNRVEKEMMKNVVKKSENPFDDKKPLPSCFEKASGGIFALQTVQSDEVEKIRRCFQNIVKKRIALTTRLGFHKIREYCLANGILNSIQYADICEREGWPERPWESKEMTSFDFFHLHIEKVEVEDVKAFLLENRILSVDDYEENRPSHFPTLQDINEGYFTQTNNFQELLPNIRRR